jgi:hypothetical protein
MQRHCLTTACRYTQLNKLRPHMYCDYMTTLIKHQLDKPMFKIGRKDIRKK